MLAGVAATGAALVCAGRFEWIYGIGPGLVDELVASHLDGGVWKGCGVFVRQPHPFLTPE